MKRIVADDATVTYPAGLEVQAHEVADAAHEVMPQLLKKHGEVQRALADRHDIARRIADLLGYPEFAAHAESVLSQMAGRASDTPWRRFHVFREADVKAAGVIRDGPVSIAYNAREDRISVSYAIQTPADLGRLFVPVGVMQSGAIQTGGLPLRDYLTANAASFLAGSSAVIHEAAETVLIRNLDLCYPTARWFNDGVANWVTLRVVEQVAPHLVPDCNRLVLPLPGDEQIRPQVNLLAWLQAVFATNTPTALQVEADAVSYRFATEALDRLLREAPAGTLATIVRKARNMVVTGGKPNTDALCGIIGEITGKDAKALLLEYVPSDVCKGIGAGKAVALLADAYAKVVGSQDYRTAAALIEQALTMQPEDVSARLNLAILGLRAGYSKAECKRQIALAAALARWNRGTTSLRATAADDDTRYVMGRFAQLIGQRAVARSILAQVALTSGWFADARAALKEMEKATGVATP
jgi:hypothetical protein